MALFGWLTDIRQHFQIGELFSLYSFVFDLEIYKYEFYKIGLWNHEFTSSAGRL